MRKTTQTSTSKEFPWVTVFMDLALRAVREVHYTHGRWSVGHHWEMDPERSTQINRNLGLTLADERTVCAAISQEFLGSSAVAGFWGKEIRFFKVESEAPYFKRSKKGGRQRVDLLIKKFVPTANCSELELVHPQAFVEAKRARLWYPNRGTSNKKSGAIQIEEIRKDIAKLREEKSYRKQVSGPKINTHILVWGVFSSDKSGDSPTEMINKLQKGISVRGIRSLPVDWTDSKPADRFTLPMLTGVLWLLLAEV
jgi:hypothetical protein